jgi:hypothetical protein
MAGSIRYRHRSRVRTAGPDVVRVTVITPSTLGTVPAMTAAVATQHPALETLLCLAVRL